MKNRGKNPVGRHYIPVVREKQTLLLAFGNKVGIVMSHRSARGLPAAGRASASKAHAKGGRPGFLESLKAGPEEVKAGLFRTLDFRAELQ